MSRKLGRGKRSKFQRQQDLMIVQDMYLDGKSQLEIAHRLGISQGQVSQDIQLIIKQWAETRISDLDRHRNEELAKLNRDEQRFTQLWLASLEFPAKVVHKSFSGKVKTKTVNGNTVMDDATSLPEYFRTSTIDDGSRGNPFFWEQIKWCRTERAKLLGLYAPKKLSATNIAGTEERSFQEGMNAKDDMLNMLMQVADKMMPRQEEPKQLSSVVNGEVISSGNSDDSDNSNAVEAELVSPVSDEEAEEAINIIPPVKEVTDNPITPFSEEIDPLSDKHFPVSQTASLIKGEKINRAKNQAPAPLAREIINPSAIKGTSQEAIDYHRNSSIESAKQVNDYVEQAHSEEDIHPLAKQIRKRR